MRRNDEQAARGFLDCLGLARHVDDQFNLGEALMGLSTLAALNGRWASAARLAGASTAVHEQIGAPPWESVTAMHERAVSAAREALGGERFAAHIQEGRQLSAEDAAHLYSASADAVASLAG